MKSEIERTATMSGRVEMPPEQILLAVAAFPRVFGTSALLGSSSRTAKCGGASITSHTSP